MNEINEDAVEIKLFSASLNSDVKYWENLSTKINSTIKTFSHNYIWHRDEFKVHLPIVNNTDPMPIHLTSTVCFGDNIEDEWFIVYLVMEMSKMHKDLIIQILDSDGDFLLIEAANYLPSWANPESTDNRVFIFKNAVHIIPPNLVDLKNKINLKEALQIIIKYDEQTQASTEIQDVIKTRIGDYPQKMEENFHRAVVNLPLDVATLLSLQPSLISPIVTAYCNHDLIDAKSCKNLHFTDYVCTEVKFTKCLYAMLMHSKLLKNVKHDYKTVNKRDIIGLKLTCGFQMIMKMLTKDLFSTKEYLKFEKNLKDNGYFKGNIEGSLEYNNLLEKSKQYFLEIECSINSSVSKQISELVGTDRFLHCKDNMKQICEKNLTEDNDDWLSIHPNQLNDLLNNRYGNQVKFNTTDVITADAVTSKLTDFLKQSSDFEGIDSNRIDDSESDSIDFEADQFANCLEKMLNLLSTGGNELSDDSDINSESDINDNINNYSVLDEELAGELNSFEESRSNSKKVVFNLAQSIKEEGLSGPSSNLLTTIGVNKTDLLDSDDD